MVPQGGRTGIRSEAQVRLGAPCTGTGRGVPQDDGEAVQWFRKAAEQGHSLRPKYNLGATCTGTGRGVPQDDGEAVQWFRKAAEQGLAKAQYNLGFMYAQGRGVPQDDGEAVQWYRKAAEQGDAHALEWLNEYGSYFTRGSSMDDVLRVQGTPTSINTYRVLGNEVWTYGASTVTFDLQTKRVTEWSEHYAEALRFACSR